MIDFLSEFSVKYVAARCKTKNFCKLTVKVTLVDQSSSNHEEPVLTWLWTSITAAICKYFSTTLGHLIFPCLVSCSYPSWLVEQVVVNCFSCRSLTWTAIIVTAYLSGYTGRICLRSNVYFQDIKKLLQIKKCNIYNYVQVNYKKCYFR